MTADMSVQAGILPVAVALGPRFEPGLAQIRREETIGIEFEKILEVCVLRVLERTVEQPDLRQMEGFIRALLCPLSLRRRPTSDQEEGQHGSGDVCYGMDVGRGHVAR